MLIDTSLRDLLRMGHETSDGDFVAHTIEHMSRTVYFMARFLAERQYKFISSVDLQGRINDELRTSDHMPTDRRFNPVDFFSEQWTLAIQGRPTSKYFLDQYLELFDRGKTQPWNYRIKPALYESVRRILSELSESPSSRSSISSNVLDAEALNASPETTSNTTLSNVNGPGETAPDLSAIAEELDKEGIFDPASPEEARVRALRAVIVRAGQPQFRAALLVAYGGRCALTECDAAPALEAAHIRPYEGVQTNVVNNGILLRADIHTLFDLDLIGIHPREGLVHISSQLDNTVYRKFEGTRVRGPNDRSATPNRAALAWRWERFLG
jgi:predicted restriction endonuclease